MSDVTYEKVGGVMWCIPHQGIVDECSDRGGVCDMKEVDGERCVIRTLWIQRRKGGAK